MSDTKFAIEYDFSNQEGVVVTDHVKGVVYAKTCEEANKKFNMLVNKSKSYSSTFIKLGKPSFLGNSLIDISTSYKVFRDGKIVKDLPIPEYVSENMNSIYKQMNNIDDKESLNEKYNVKNQRELERLKEYWQSSQDHCREWIAEGMYDFVLKHLHPEIHAFVADTCRITVDKQHPDLVVVLKMINDESFMARVERMNRTGSNSNSIDFCEPYTVEISKQQPHCKELYTVTDKLCADYNNAVKLIQQNELVLVGKGKSAVWTRFSTNDSAEVAYNKQKADIITEMISDSKYSDPIRVRVQIDTSNAKFKDGYDLQAAIKRTISGVTMQPEILVDESDGSYQLCFPGKSDWLKSVTEMLQYNISGKLTVEEV